MTTPLFIALLCVTAALTAILTFLGIGLALDRKSAHKGRERPKRRASTSRLIALGVLAVDGVSTFAVLYLCWLAITTQYEGALPYLTTLIGALQASTAIVLSGYFFKSKAENTQGGITYDTAMGGSGDAQG